MNMPLCHNNLNNKNVLFTKAIFIMIISTDKNFNPRSKLLTPTQHFDYCVGKVQIWATIEVIVRHPTVSGDDGVAL